MLVTLSSVGAGAIGMTALVLLYPRTPIAKLVGSDIAHAVPLTLIAGIGHWLLGSVNWLLLSSLLIGSLPGVYIGSHFAARVPDRDPAPTAGRDAVAGGHKDVAFVRTGRICCNEGDPSFSNGDRRRSKGGGVSRQPCRFLAAPIGRRNPLPRLDAATLPG